MVFCDETLLFVAGHWFLKSRLHEQPKISPILAVNVLTHVGWTAKIGPTLAVHVNNPDVSSRKIRKSMFYFHARGRFLCVKFSPLRPKYQMKIMAVIKIAFLYFFPSITAVNFARILSKLRENVR
jgi:hypothetical protein